MKTITLITIIIIQSLSFSYAETLGDINNDNYVNAVEAIHALQVSAGIKNSITVTNNNSLNAADGNPKNALYIDNDGNIGVGTTTPSANFTINPSNKNLFNKKLSGLVTIAPNSSTVIGDNNTLFSYELKVGDTVLLANEFYTISSINSDKEISISRELVAGVFNEPMFTSSNILHIYDSSNQAALVLDNAGNLGIGISNPRAKLDVNGQLIRTLSHNSDIGTRFVNESTDSKQATDRILIFKKIKDETDIKIEYNDYLGINGTCGRCDWEIRIDGSPCPNGSLLFNNYFCCSNASGIGSMQTIKGFCSGISAGEHEIQIWFNISDSRYIGKGECQTGITTSRWQIQAEETY